MADKPDGSIVFAACGCWQKPIDIAIFVHFDLRKPDAFEFFGKEFGKFELLFGTRTALAVLVGGGGETDVF